MKSLLIFITALLLIGQEPSLKPATPQRRTEPPTLLSLEVKYNPTQPPAYISVRGPETKPRWIWVTRFVRLPGVAPADPMPIHAVRFETQFNGETADVKVTLLRGRGEGFEREDKVGSYHLGLNEQISVTELRSFGIEPATLTLINTVPPLPPAPGFENQTKSIDIVSVTSTNIPLPAYKLAVRNLSQKPVHALKVDVISDGRPRLLSFWQGEIGKPLIEPGGVYERALQVVVPQKTQTAYEPGTATENVIYIRAVVFEDLTFEGDEEAACRYETFVVGRRLWLKRVLPFMDQELAHQALAPAAFKQKFEALTYELEPHERTEKSAVSAKCPNPDSRVDVSTQTLKLELLRELDQIITTRPAPPINFRAWLEGKRSDYRGWLARLN
jgi:hypothetical protein